MSKCKYCQGDAEDIEKYEKMKGEKRKCQRKRIECFLR